MNQWTKDVSEEIRSGVLERSNAVPVLVDFGLLGAALQSAGPLLEKLADEHAGEFILAKSTSMKTRAWRAPSVSREFRR